MTLTSEGFVRPRLNDIKADYDQRVIDALGPINTNPDSVIGQLIAIFAAALDDAYEALQANYDAMYPMSASGTALDGAVAYVGIERLAAAPTTVVAMCYGTEGTLIPAGAIARSLDNKQYVASVDTTISRSNAGDVDIGIVTVQDSADYQILLDGVSAVYNSGIGATATSIAAGLAAVIDSTKYIATATAGVLNIVAIDKYSGFTVTVDSKMSIDKLGTPVTFAGMESGAYALLANTLTVMDTLLSGWDSINNLIDGTTGTFTETDAELRARHSLAVRSLGAGTTMSIRARMLQDVEGVTYVRVYENKTNAIDAYNLPAHSFETVIEGGTDQAVAEELFVLKPAGIETYGNTSVQVLDDNGDAQYCNFSRPTTKYAWVRVSVVSLYPEEILTATVAQAINDAVLAHGNALNIGEDLITQRFYGAIYEATNGIGSITVEVALTALPTDAPSYTTVNVAVARTELAAFDATRISVIGV